MISVTLDPRSQEAGEDTQVVIRTKWFLLILTREVRWQVSYPNFVRGPLLDDMQLLFGPCEVLGTHH